jgi:hypothetical protein
VPLPPLLLAHGECILNGSSNVIDVPRVH